jgi:hypothetical protein
MGSHIPRFLDLRSHGGHLASLSHHSVMLVRDADLTQPGRRAP